MAVEIRINPFGWKQDFLKGFEASFSSRKRSSGTLTGGLAIFLLSLFSSNPTYSVQMIFSGVENWGMALMTRFTGLLMNTGYEGLFLTLIFSLLAGVTLTNTAVQFRMNKISLDAVGALPGFLAGGCASCGVGVLSLLGFSGVLASMPFEGNLLRLGGVILLCVLIVRTGNPEACKIN